MSAEKVIEEKKQGEALVTEQVTGNHKKLFIESYGCQMNLNDSEIVASILANEGFNTTQILEEADLVLVNTCHEIYSLLHDYLGSSLALFHQ